MKIRNYCYDVGVFSVSKAEIPTIGVGNLSVGGTGKSPMVLYLVQLLQKEFRVGVLSRGYGRKSRGFVWVDAEASSTMVGDEAVQLRKRFPKIEISVCEDRVFGTNKMLSEKPLQVLVYDDVFQHRAVQPGYQLLITSFGKPFYNDYVLPSGNLRESRMGAKRADAVVVTKSPPDISLEMKDLVASKIRKYAPNSKIFFSYIQYCKRVASCQQEIEVEALSDYNILLITGIASSQDFVNKVISVVAKVEHCSYNDHYSFTDDDIKYILQKFHQIEGKKIILTTEKDYSRLQQFSQILSYLYYWRIEFCFFNEEKFIKNIKNYVTKNQRKF